MILLNEAEEEEGCSTSPKFAVKFVLFCSVLFFAAQWSHVIFFLKYRCLAPIPRHSDAIGKGCDLIGMLKALHT